MRVRAACSAAILALAVGLGACGVPIDESPRAIGRSTIDAETEVERQTPTTSDSPHARKVTAYFLRNEKLVPVEFSVDGSPSLADALTFATSEPPDDSYNTSIPAGTSILSVEVVDGVATINLTPEINDISGQAQKLAYAQLVFTAFSFRQLDAVRFEVDGKAVDTPTDNGNRESVTRADYVNLRPAS
jgi:spore germination protein GerM